MTNVGFIGLGTMGLPMARNILKHGHRVVGFDMSSEARARHVANGGVEAQDAAEAAAEAEILFTMLPNGEIVRSALFDNNGALDRLPENALVVDMSTIHPAETDAIRQDLEARGFRMVDAPIGRTSLHAETGESQFMVGGTAPDLEQARPVLECMGTEIIDCGGPGKGIRMKIVNNLMSTALNVLTAEVLTLAEAAGLECDLAIEVMSGTTAGQGHMTTTYPARVLKGDLSPAFMIDLANKDLGLALDLSAALDIPLTMAQTAERTYQTAQAEGRGQQDWTAVFDMLRRTYLTPRS